MSPLNSIQEYGLLVLHWLRELQRNKKIK
jgi:hypothetical protein